MYTFFRFRARYLLLVVATGYGTLGCSSGPAPTIIPLESTQVVHSGCEKLPGSKAPSVVYRCKGERGPVFVAALKDCSLSEKFSFQATTRQLFVGLTAAKVAHQGPVTLGNTKALQSVVVGTIDAEPVIMSTFTFRKKSCVTDIVLWQGLEEESTQQPRIDSFITSSKQLASTLLNDQLPVQDVTPTEG